MVPKQNRLDLSFDDEKEYSKTAARHDALQIRHLVEKIAALGKSDFKKLNFPNDALKEALETAANLKINSDERRRQLKYAAALLRQDDPSDLLDQLKTLGASSVTDPNIMRLVNLREYLIAGGMKAVDEFCAALPDTDRNKLRALIRKAQKERVNNGSCKNPAAKALFHFLQDEIERTGAVLPSHMTANT